MANSLKSNQEVTQFTLRLPTEILNDVRELAAAEDRSVNGWIVQALRKAVAEAKAEYTL
jgi:hypothetical protein